MAIAAQAQSLLAQHKNSAFSPRCPCVFRSSRFCAPSRFSSARICAVSDVAVGPEPSTEVKYTSDVELFACTICYEPLIRKGPSGFNLSKIYRSGFKCMKCKKSYSSKNIYLDLTVTSGTKEYNESKPAGTELFKCELLAIFMMESTCVFHI